MKRALRWALGLVLMAGLTGLNQFAAAGPRETSLKITIYAYNFAQVDGRTLREAEQVATGIFRKTGVETQWIDIVSTLQNMQSRSAAHGPYNLSDIQLEILPPAMVQRLGLPKNVMGLAPGTERDRQLVYLFYDKVKALAERQMRARVDGGISTYAIRVQILGHAIAHEIGHILLNLESHSDTGIMRANWDLKQLQDACYGYLVFTPPQAEAIRLEVARRSLANLENTIPGSSPVTYAVIGATAGQEKLLRSQIQVMHPGVLPLRVFFVPHWKYLAAARDFRLHVPTGYGSLMFTHLPSKTVFIDNDRYAGKDWLGHWIAHELGHLSTNSAKEEDAEKAAREYRRRMRNAR